MSDEKPDDQKSDDQDRFEAFVSTEAREHYNNPPTVPSDRMWEAIETARTKSRAKSKVLSLRHFRSAPVWLKIAAALVLGLGLGRLTLREQGSGSGSVAVAPPATAPAAGANGAAGGSLETATSLPYRIATQRHLDQSDALLTSFRARAGEPGAAVDPEAAEDIGLWARSLLSNTRLLLDSPAGQDAELAVLLNDLEFVLAQIVQLRQGDDEGRGYINEGLRERGLLLRVRSVAAQSPTRM